MSKCHIVGDHMSLLNYYTFWRVNNKGADQTLQAGHAMQQRQLFFFRDETNVLWVLKNFVLKR